MALDTDLLDQLSEIVAAGKARSVSALIRDALELFDLDAFTLIKPQQKMVSVRLPVEVREMLKQTATAHSTTLSHLVRTALENYLVEQVHAEPTEPSEVAVEPPPPVPVVETPKALLKPKARVKRKAKASGSSRAGKKSQSKPKSGKRAQR